MSEKKMRGEMPPITEAKEQREFDERMDVFFSDLERWKKWVQDLQQFVQKRFEAAEAHKGMKYDSNIYRTPDGQIWEMGTIGSPDSDYYGGGYWPRGNREAAQKDLPEGAVRANPDGSDEWAWESLDDVNARRPSWMRPEGQDDRAYWERSLARDIEDIQFAENLFQRREEIERWASARANSSIRNDISVYSRDWDQLMEFLGIPARVHEALSDHTSLKLSLAQGIDAVAGQKVVRNVAY